MKFLNGDFDSIAIEALTQINQTVSR